MVSPTAHVREESGAVMLGIGGVSDVSTTSSAVSVSPFELTTWRVIGKTPFAWTSQVTTRPVLSPGPANEPSWSRSQFHAARVDVGSGSVDADASRVMVAGAVDTAGVTVPRAIGSTRCRMRTTRPPSMST